MQKHSCIERALVQPFTDWDPRVIHDLNIPQPVQKTGAYMKHILVGGFNTSEKYQSVGNIIPNIWRIKNVPNHHFSISISRCLRVRRQPHWTVRTQHLTETLFPLARANCQAPCIGDGREQKQTLPSSCQHHPIC